MQNYRILADFFPVETLAVKSTIVNQESSYAKFQIYGIAQIFYLHGNPSEKRV